jgi:hypothetical protein
MADPEPVSADWAADINAARLARDPLRARALLYVMVIVVLAPSPKSTRSPAAKPRSSHRGRSR